MQFVRRAVMKTRRVFGLTPEAVLLKQLQRITSQVASPVFVKVGANDGITGDPCGRFLLDHRSWSGILVEPVPYCVEKLRASYGTETRFVIEDCAIGDTEGATPFYFVSERAAREIPDLPTWHDQLGSFNRQHIVNHLGGVLEPYIESLPVNVRSLASVVAGSRFKRVDVLHIDTEGHDWRVLQSFDLAKYRPACLIVEHAHLSSADREAMHRLLLDHQYKVLKIQMDFVALGKVQPSDV